MRSERRHRRRPALRKGAAQSHDSLRHGHRLVCVSRHAAVGNTPSQPAAFLGFHFILSPPRPEAIVSRMLLTIELTTTAIAGLYLSFLFRTKS